MVALAVGDMNLDQSVAFSARVISRGMMGETAIIDLGALITDARGERSLIMLHYA